jgi:serine/threonine protein kinase
MYVSTYIYIELCIYIELRISYKERYLCIYLGDLLGEGGYSVVKLATSKIDKSNVAVKIISKNLLSENDLESLQQEVSILQQLHHKNVTRLIDYFDEADHYYMVLGRYCI